MSQGLCHLLTEGHGAQTDGGDVQLAAAKADKFHTLLWGLESR
jgi:hypothetical protein